MAGILYERCTVYFKRRGGGGSSGGGVMQP